MPDHSKEPWVAHECGVDEFFICEQSPPGLPGEDTGWGKQIGEIDGKANARRVLACVNELADIPIEIIESGAIKQLLHELLTVPVTVRDSSPQAEMLELWLNKIRVERQEPSKDV